MEGARVPGHAIAEKKRKPLPAPPGSKPLPAPPGSKAQGAMRKPLPAPPGSKPLPAPPGGIPLGAGNGAVTALVEGGRRNRSGQLPPPVPDRSTKPSSATAPSDGQVPPNVVQALVTLSKSSPEQINRVFGQWVEAAAGDDEERERDLGRFGKVTTTGSAKVGAGYGGYAGAQKETLKLGELGWAVEVLAEAGFVAGATLELEGSIAKDFGPLAVKAQASLEAFAGISTKVQGSAFLSRGDKWWELGAGAAGKAGFFAGAKGATEANVTFDAKGLGLELGGEVEAMAGVEASAEGEVAIDLARGRIALAGEASFFAGAKLTGSGGGTFRLYGRDAVKVRGSASATAGIGEEASIGFKLSRGVLTFDLGLGLTLGAGFEGDVSNTVDFKPIAVLIMRKYGRHFKTHREVEVTGLLASDSTLRRKLRTYAAFKAAELRSGAENFVKIEKVQAYVDLAVDRKRLKANRDRSLDAAITQLITEECRVSDRGVAPTKVVVEYGKITDLDYAKNALDRIKDRGKATAPNTYTAAPTVGKSGKNLREVG